jgi:two-component system osmolarity sensor histidine kinase EnvZ
MGRVRSYLNRTVVPKTLLFRSLLIVILPLILLQIVLTVVFYNRHWDTVTRWLASGVAGEVALLSERLSATDSAVQRAALLAQARRHMDLSVTFLPNGNLQRAVALAELGGRFTTHIDRKILEAFEERLTVPFAVDLRSDEDDRIAVYVQLRDGLLTVLAPRRRVTSTTTWLLAAWMVGASFVLLAIAIYYMNLQVRPIRRLARAVDRFGKGRDPGDFRIEGASEIRRAARAFNLMRERTLRFMSQRTEMLAAVSHDLRTPLTRMKLELEMLDERTDPIIAGLKSDVLEMEQLVEAYLAFARGDGREVVELTPLAPLLEGMQQRAERAGAKVELQLDGPIEVALRPVAFRRCLANLVDNACRHARSIWISARRDSEQVEISVDDDGPGIPEAYLDKVVQPFVRLDNSRSRATGGLGLGLTIARDVALGHGGDLLLGASPRGGLRALVRLPT